MAVEEKVTFCRICEPLCGMVATVEDGKLVKLRPDPDNPLSKGYACPKGIAMTEVQNDPDRVTHPLKRNADGEFERVSWDDALDDIGARLGRVLEERGPGAVGWYLGNPGAFSYSHVLWRKGFLDCIGSPHAYGAGSQDVNNRFAASALMYGIAAGGADPRHRAHGLPAHGGRQPARLARIGAQRAAGARAAAGDRGPRRARGVRRPAPVGDRRASSSTSRSAPTATRGCCCR